MSLTLFYIGFLIKMPGIWFFQKIFSKIFLFFGYVRVITSIFSYKNFLFWLCKRDIITRYPTQKLSHGDSPLRDSESSIGGKTIKIMEAIVINKENLGKCEVTLSTPRTAEDSEGNKFTYYWAKLGSYLCCTGSKWERCCPQEGNRGTSGRVCHCTSRRWRWTHLHKWWTWQTTVEDSGQGPLCYPWLVMSGATGPF